MSIRHVPEVDPPPLRESLHLNAAGVITSPPWLAWLARKVFPTLRMAVDLRNAGVFEPSGGRDTGPEIEQAAEQRRESCGRDREAEIRQAIEAGREAGGRDIEPEIRQAVEAQRDPGENRSAAALDELRAAAAASDFLRIASPELDEMRAALGAVESRRPGTDVQWICSSHADRLTKYIAASMADGSRYFEVDRTVIYVAFAGHWLYASGQMIGTLSPDTKPSDLGSDDAGFRFHATDYKHVYRWTGAAWEFAAEDEGSGFFRDFGVAPNGGAWQVCDGSATTYALADGTTAAFTTPNLTGGTYRKGAAAYTGTVNAAGAGSLSGDTSDDSAGTPAGSNASESTHVHAIDHDHASFNSSTENASGLAGPGGNSVSSSPHTHVIDVPALTGASGAGSAHTHTFTGSAMGNHHHSLSGGGVTLPTHVVSNLAVIVYFRR